MPTPPPLVLVVSADNRYAIGLAVTVRSALESMRRPRPVHLYVADGGLSALNRRKILASLEGFDVTCRFVKPDMRRLRRLPTRGYIQTPTYFRLLVPQLVPASCTKALYLDADVLVRGDIGALFDTPLGHHAAAAVHSLMCPYVCCLSGITNFDEVGLAADTPYFNGGVLLLNVALWRREKLSAKALAYVEKHRASLNLFDNDALVATLAGRWKPLDRRWNVEHPALPEEGFLIHFIMQSKPWHHGNRHLSRPAWLSVLQRTAWKGFRPAPPARKPRTA